MAFQTEEDASRYFDDQLSKNGFFDIEKEVPGKIIFQSRLMSRQRHGKNGVRIDRLLTPSQSAIRSGWMYGAIGVEIKKENDFGRALAQVLDYRNACFKSNKSKLRIFPDFFLIFPYEKPSGDIASFMAQNQIGGIVISKGTIKAFLGQVKLFSIDIKSNKLSINPTLPGQKTGNRG